jgi:MFS family permease
MMLGTALIVSISAVPLFTLLSNASLLTVIFLRFCFVLFGIAFCAPFHAWAQELVPPAHRYAVISFGYALGSQLLGGPTAAISLWCFKQTGIVASVSWYWASLATLSSLAIVWAMKIKKEVTT